MNTMYSSLISSFKKIMDQLLSTLPRSSYEKYISRFDGNIELAAKFSYIFRKRSVIVERNVILYDFEEFNLKVMFENNGWLGLVSSITPAAVEFVREFYCVLSQYGNDQSH